jgi:hypothetical protein
LLKPRGYLWIETPNIDSHGYACFGSHWRGLEPPRHLQIFTPKVLQELLRGAGFVDIEFAPWQPNWRAMAELSLSPESALGRNASLEESVGRRDPEKREFITLTATVPT